MLPFRKVRVMERECGGREMGEFESMIPQLLLLDGWCCQGFCLCVCICFSLRGVFDLLLFLVVAFADAFRSWFEDSLISAMSLRGIEASMTVNAAADGDDFTAYMEQVLCAALKHEPKRGRNRGSQNHNRRQRRRLVPPLRLRDTAILVPL